MEEVKNLHVFNESRTLVMDKSGNKYRVYLLDVDKGLVGVERFSIHALPIALEAFNIRVNCVEPQLKSSFIKKIKPHNEQIKHHSRRKSIRTKSSKG